MKKLTLEHFSEITECLEASGESNRTKQHQLFILCLQVETLFPNVSGYKLTKVIKELIKENYEHNRR